MSLPAAVRSSRSQPPYVRTIFWSEKWLCNKQPAALCDAENRSSARELVLKLNAERFNNTFARPRATCRRVRGSSPEKKQKVVYHALLDLMPEPHLLDKSHVDETVYRFHKKGLVKAREWFLFRKPVELWQHTGAGLWICRDGPGMYSIEKFGRSWVV